jgi:hypothetical protein
VVTAYVVAGLLLVRGRQSDRAVTIFRFRLRVRRELAVLGVVAGVALGALGLLLLGRVPWPIPAALIGVAFFTLPPGMSLLSEDAIDRLSISSAGTRWRGYCIGLAILASAAAAVWALADSALVLVVFAVLAVLVVALASSTLADVAAVLALVALMGITPR